MRGRSGEGSQAPKRSGAEPHEDVRAPLVGAPPSALPITEGGYETRAYLARKLFAKETRSYGIAMQDPTV